ncbi:hypothetical protein CDL12_11775 [Handroanthus impetiginosus]|uniref:C2H2-type domain-containing protein n=1 Tax=Handroanthus impetiginosus TaxID=429701 RepID=A0A2G9HDF4_9LAMI|nr:hypothetical protein CDL12_11775 [Handroanthus impetiginosus]
MKGFYKVKDSWDFASYYNTDQDLVAAGGFIWPPRCYKCSFCKREFRSAQALGGHMNVHRRDRAARLRHESPPRDICNNQSNFLNLNVCPNPSFNQNPSSFLPISSEFPHFTSKLPQILPSSATEMATTIDLVKIKDAKGLSRVEKCNEFVNEKVCENNTKKRGFVKLDLEIGLINECKEELDLELRLGCS